MDRLHQEMGDDPFFALLNDIEPRATTLLEQYLKEAVVS